MSSCTTALRTRVECLKGVSSERDWDRGRLRDAFSTGSFAVFATSFGATSGFFSGLLANSTVSTFDAAEGVLCSVSVFVSSLEGGCCMDFCSFEVFASGFFSEEERVDDREGAAEGAAFAEDAIGTEAEESFDFSGAKAVTGLEISEVCAFEPNPKEGTLLLIAWSVFDSGLCTG